MSGIQFYHDDLVVNSFLYKTAQDSSSLISAISTYFLNNIKTESIVNLLAPGVVFNILSKGLGLTWV